MSTITAEELMIFLRYLAEYGIAPKNHISIHAVNFTLRDLDSAIEQMQRQGVHYQAYLQHKNEDSAHGAA